MFAQVRQPFTLFQKFLFAMIGMNMLITLVGSLVFYTEQKEAMLSSIDSKLVAVSTLARELLPSDYHDRITGPESVSDAEFQRIVARNNRLCRELGLEYIWSLMDVGGRIVFTTSTSPDKVVNNRRHAKFFELHSNPEFYVDTFKSMRTTYRSIHDKWGDIRVVLIPYADSHGRKYLFGASVSLAEVHQYLKGLLWQVVFLGLAIFVLSLSVGYWSARVVTAPVQQLMRTVREIAAGNVGAVASECGSFEQAEFARHFNRMNQNLQEKISELKVAHTRLLDQHEIERRQAKDDLVMSEQRYFDLLNFAVDGILVGTHDGIVVQANEYMCMLFGKRRDEIIGHHVSEMPFKPESVRQTPFEFDRLWEGETILRERTILRADGSEVEVEMHTKMMTDGTLQSFYRDITERKRTERALRESENRYRQLFEMESDALLLVENGSCRILDANLAAQAMYGFSREELCSMLNVDLSAEPEQTECFSKGKAYKIESPFKISLRKHRRKDGSVFPVEIIGRFFELNGRSVHIAAIRDITERTKVQEVLESWNATLERRVAERTEEVERHVQKLHALTARLVRAEEDERQRLSDVLHEDLQQVLVAARMTLGVTLGSVSSDEIREPLGRIDDMLTRSLRLTRNLVQEITIQAVNEGDLLFALRWIADRMQEKFGLEIELACEKNIGRLGSSVYVCLYRAVQEILFNVVKHAGVRKARIEVKRCGDANVQITVRDEGRGFASAESEKGNGGFGLFNIRERIEGLSGNMTVHSVLGQGTTIVLTMPLNDAP